MLDPASLPHWPYARAVDQELAARGIPAGAVRVDRDFRRETALRLVFTWDASRCAGPGGIRLIWHDDTGWAHSLLRPDAVSAIPRGPLTALRRVYATPRDVAEVAAALVSWRFRQYNGAHHGQWEQAAQVRAAIDAFHLTVNTASPRTSPALSHGPVGAGRTSSS
ncbi:hypothetical protein [Streptomyces sp. NPDC060205]|uniref:hypothetical protein n=1 Tax=Streptomyces sp. NPDC060205 TaxID=3347072 RepID=UPI003651C53A